MPGRIGTRRAVLGAVDVSPRGAVRLGPTVACDGFLSDVTVRVQTHIHDDHMAGFNSSKHQLIVCSLATRALLIQSLDAELPYRSNLIGLAQDELFTAEDIELKLHSSRHMLGAVQVSVEYSGGERLGYSGDFTWPLERVPTVDVLVLDSTNGSPMSPRSFARDETDDGLVELVSNAGGNGAVHVMAHRGTLHRVGVLLSDAFNTPMVGSRRLCGEVDIHRRFGYAIGPVYEEGSQQYDEVLAEGRYIRLYGKGDGDPFGVEDGTIIYVSAYRSRETEPVVSIDERCFRVVMSEHADFEGIVEYVRATSAHTVVTDSVRSAQAATLAVELQRRLGVDARPSSSRRTRAWGT